MVYLDKWAFMKRSISPYSAPETWPWVLVGNVTGHPEYARGKTVATSPIKCINPGLRVVKTQNTEYVLLEPDPEWVAEATANGHTVHDFFNMFPEMP
jgi:hypothetical protein